MEWFILITYMNTTNVSVIQFQNEEQCKIYIEENMTIIQSLATNLKEAKCYPGTAPTNSTNSIWPLLK
jgi:hypothetical protein